MRFIRVAAAAALIAGTSLLPSTATSLVPVVSFHVVGPEGLPVPNAVVVVSVLGESYSHVRTLSGTAAGNVIVPIPADDPVAAQHLAAGQPVNVLIRVFDKKPGSPDINATYVTASFGVDAFGVFGELSSVTGKTFALLPGRTSFTAASAVSGVAAAAGGSCPPSPNNAPVMCYLRDFPDWSLHTQVPVAINHGAGPDMQSKIHYNSTKVTQTSVAVQAGYAGYAQADGTVAFENTTKTKFEFADHGNGEYATALLDTAFMRERSGMCYAEGGSEDGDWVCQLETVYRPYEATGTYSHPWFGANGGVDRTYDCWAHVDNAYEPETKSETRLSFALRLGPSESWAIPNEGLYANTTITQQTHTGEGFLRRWEVTSRSYEHHYVYVVGGMVGLDPSSAARATCVRSQLGNVVAAATDEDLRVVQPQGHVDGAPAVPDDTSEVEAEPHHQVCGRMPDRCD